MFEWEVSTYCFSWLAALVLGFPCLPPLLGSHQYLLFIRKGALCTGLRLGIHTAYSATCEAEPLSSCSDGGENASAHANLGQSSTASQTPWIVINVLHILTAYFPLYHGMCTQFFRCVCLLRLWILLCRSGLGFSPRKMFAEYRCERDGRACERNGKVPWKDDKHRSRETSEFFPSFLLFFLCHRYRMWKFSVQGLNLCHSSNLSCGSDSAGSLASCVTRELQEFFTFQFNTTQTMKLTNICWMFTLCQVIQNQRAHCPQEVLSLWGHELSTSETQ